MKLPCCDFEPPTNVRRGTAEFSRLHRLHHATHVDDRRTLTVPLEVDLLELYVALDQLIAHAHEPGVLPEVTPGAQALISAFRRGRDAGRAEVTT